MSIGLLQYQFSTLAEVVSHPNTAWADLAQLTLLGHTSQGDGFCAVYYWDPTNTNSHNFPLVIKQTASGATGRWLLYASQVDWNSATVSSLKTILNKPVLHAVATSGNYNDLSNKPSIKRQETFTGTTNASGNYTVTFAQSFSTAPDVQAQMVNPADNDFVRVTSITTTGCTVNARRRTDIVGLLPTFANLASASVTVLITER